MQQLAADYGYIPFSRPDKTHSVASGNSYTRCSVNALSDLDVPFSAMRCWRRVGRRLPDCVNLSDTVYVLARWPLATVSY